jgi:hypothetical protein
MESMAIYTDPGLVLFAALALLVLVFVILSRKVWHDLPALLLIATLAMTVMIFGSPGTAANHLLDVQVASVILLATWIANSPSWPQKQLSVYGLGLLTLIAAIPLLQHIRTWNAWYRPHQFQRVIEVIGPASGPILSENPVIPALAGQYPYVLDPWMVQLLQKRRVGFAEPLLDRLRNRSFSAVVLSADPAHENVRRWYDTVSFGPGFTPVLLENYKLSIVIDKDWIYVPIARVSEGGKSK